MKTAKILLSVVLVAMALCFTGCKHKQATVYFTNEYKFPCAAAIYEGELKDVSDVQPQYTFVATTGKTVVDVCKLPEPCTVVFFIGEAEVEDITLMRQQYPMTYSLAGSATVTLTVDSKGMYGVESSNM